MTATWAGAVVAGYLVTGHLLRWWLGAGPVPSALPEAKVRSFTLALVAPLFVLAGADLAGLLRDAARQVSEQITRRRRDRLSGAAAAATAPTASRSPP